MQKITHIKPEIRIAGFDDCAFKFGQKEVVIIGVVFRGGDYLDGLVSTRIKVDGLDSTEKIARCLKQSKYMEEIRVIMLPGITFGGFNIVDLEALSEETCLPVISVIRENPDMKKIKKALERFPDCKERLEIMKKAGKIRKLEIKNKSTAGHVYYQFAMIGREKAEKIIKLTATRSIIPEPLRIAGIICKGLKEEGPK